MPQALSPSVALLRVVGLAEGVSCIGLFVIAMPLRHFTGKREAVSIAGALHGGFFLAFLAVLVVVMIRRRWSLRRGLLAAIAAVVPFGTFVIDRRLHAWDADPSA